MLNGTEKLNTTSWIIATQLYLVDGIMILVTKS